MVGASQRPLLVLVGGFLGAGKTRLLLRAAEVLAERQIRSAIITNDQAANLVDTRWSANRQGDVSEVAGGCFCCRFDEFIEAASTMRAHGPQVIFAEPVGSCADLIATVVRPIADIYADQFRLAPFTVLVDPAKALQIAGEQGDVAYLFRKQIEEAEIVCFSKSDLQMELPELATASPIRSLSAKTGEGVEAWLDEISSGTLTPAATTLDLDYGRYARAEAALGWVNAQIKLDLETAASPAFVVGSLLDDIDRRLTEGGALIAHLKILDESGTGPLKGAICRNGGEAETEGDLLASPCSSHLLTINLRAEADPAILRNAVEQALAAVSPGVAIQSLQAFRPAEPRPVHRYA